MFQKICDVLISGYTYPVSLMMVNWLYPVLLRGLFGMIGIRSLTRVSFLLLSSVVNGFWIMQVGCAIRRLRLIKLFMG